MPRIQGAGNAKGPIDEATGLSVTPQQIRARMRRRGVNMSRDVDLYVEHVYRKPLAEWDLEELARGRPRNKHGTFSGACPQWVTPVVMREAKRRLAQNTFGELAIHLPLAIQVIVNLMKSKALDERGRPLVDAATKFKAAAFLVEHVMGKPKASVEIEGADVVKSFLANALVLDDGDPAHPVVDGQFYESPDDEEEDDDDE
jgi:hypothetical protein